MTVQGSDTWVFKTDEKIRILTLRVALWNDSKQFISWRAEVMVWARKILIWPLSQMSLCTKCKIAVAALALPDSITYPT